MSLYSDVVRRQVLTGFAIVLALLMLAPGAGAAGDPHPAEIIVRDLVGQVSAVVGEAEGQERGLRTALVPVLEARTDVALIGRLALGAHWRRASPEERQEYQALFHDFMLQSLANRVRPHVGSALDVDEALEVRGTRPAGRRDVLVATIVHPAGRPAINIGWRLRERDGQYVIIDLVVEGVSLLVTQRADFAAVIERAGLAGLLDELRARTSAAT